MLMIVRLHSFRELLHDLRCIGYALCFEIVSFRVLLVSDADHLWRSTSAQQPWIEGQSEKSTCPESLGVPPANLAPYDRAKGYPARLGATIK